MTELYIVRHGIAVDRQAPGIVDAKRPLTPKGMERIRLVGRGLLRLGVKPQRLYTSPWLRALQTAELLAAELGLEPPGSTEAMLPSSPKSQVLALLNAEEATSVALVGHEPHVSELTAYLLTGRETGCTEYRKGGVACLAYEGRARAGAMTLRWLLTSKQLRLLAAASDA